MTDEEKIKDFQRLWIRINKDKYKSSSVSAVEKRVKKKMALTKPTDFDNEEHNVINFNNGFYDLDKQTLFPHSPHHLFFKKVDVDYSSDEGYLQSNNPSNNEWLRFLNTTFDGDANKIRYLQKAIGYTFSTSTREEKVFLIKGVKHSGKKTFLDTIGKIMKDYSAYEFKELVTSQYNNTNYLLDARAKLKGKRFLYITDISTKNKVNSTVIRILAGDRYLTGAERYKGKITYIRQFKCWIATNNLDFDSFDDSVKVILAIIEFNNQFYEAGTPEAKETGRVIDEQLKHRLMLKHNKEFIIRWIIDGYKLYQQEGLKPTKEMLETLNQFERDNGSFKKSLNEEEKTIDNRLDISDIHKAYCEFEQEEYGTREDRLMTLRRFFKISRNIWLSQHLLDKKDNHM